jgi:hypothetical protein
MPQRSGASRRSTKAESSISLKEAPESPKPGGTHPLRRNNKNKQEKVKRKSKTNLAKQLSSTTPPENGSREAVRDILNRLFGDSAESLVKSLADSNQLTPEEKARMNEIFGKQAKRRRRKH